VNTVRQLHFQTRRTRRQRGLRSFVDAGSLIPTVYHICQEERKKSNRLGTQIER
jgi:hypothetical protein